MRRRVRVVEHGQMSLPRERVLGVSAAKTRAGSRAGTRLAFTFWSSGAEARAARDADTLAIADEAVASGRPRNAAAVRPRRERAGREPTRPHPAYGLATP